MKEKQPKKRRFSKKAVILTVLVTLVIAASVFFGVIAFFNEDVPYEYASVAPTLRIEEQPNGQVDFWAELPAHAGIAQTYTVAALDHEADIAYMQYTVYTMARRKEIEFGEPVQKVFYTRDADGTASDVMSVEDENGNPAEYRKVIQEIRYAIFDANGLAGITYREEPVTLWSFALPDGAVKTERAVKTEP